MPRVLIIGGGLAGLTTAFRLRQLMPSAEVTVLESRSRVGGNIGTVHRDGFRVERGPNGFLDAKPSTIQLCRDLGLAERLLTATEAARKNRYVFVGDRLQRLPASPLGILSTPLLSFKGKLDLLREPFRRKPIHPDPDESVAAFARRRFGREAADIFIDALVTGIHAGDPELLSVKAAFPRLVKFENEFGSVIRGVLQSSKQRRRDAQARGEKPISQRMWSFREGLHVLIQALRDTLGEVVISDVAVRRLVPGETGWHVHAEGHDAWAADAVVLACPAHEQAPIVADFDPRLAEDLAAIRFNRVAVAALGYRQSDVPGNHDGFGYIAPENTRRDILGVQWCSSIFPDRAPPGFVLWRVLAGGTNRPDVLDWDDDTLVARCHAELQHAMGVRGDPVFREIIRWPKAIPQYQIGHFERVQRIEGMVASHAGLFVTGNSFHGIAMNDVTEQAEILASRLTARLSQG